jgi:hypothetical protein
VTADLFAASPPAKRGIGGHESPVNETDTWLTPPHILKALGRFDLDPCAAPPPRPWPTADEHWTVEHGPLNRPWHGRVWLNPPYGRRSIIEPWMNRMAEHGCGTAIIFARTETATFFSTAWQRATAMLFLRGRLTFHRGDGPPGDSNGGAPSVLLAYGEADADALRRSGLPGAFVAGWHVQEAA